MARARLVVALLDQEPRFLRARPPPFMRTSDQRPRSFSPCKRELEVPVAIAARADRRRASTCRGPRSRPSPRRTGARGITPSKLAYSSGWSSTWTASRLSAGSRLGPLGTAQLCEHAVELEPEVVVQLAGGVLLHDEAQSRLSPRRSAPLGLRRLREIALATVMLEAHGGLSTAESMPHADVLRVRARRLAAGNSCKRPQYRLPEIVSRGGGGCRAARQPA